MSPLRRPKAHPGPLRIGVFGGAFDPPHKAHVALAQAALEQLALDQLHVLPTGVAWHKARALSAPEHRLAMSRLAFCELHHVVIDEREIQRAGPTFTIDTLDALQAENAGAELFLVMGADQFTALRQWHRWQAIVEVAIICVADRAISVRASGMFDSYGGQKHRFLSLQMPEWSVSATQVRQLAAAPTASTAELLPLVPAAVARYIAAQRLYKVDAAAGSSP